MHIQNVTSSNDGLLYDYATGALAVWSNPYAWVHLDENKYSSLCDFIKKSGRYIRTT